MIYDDLPVAATVGIGDYVTWGSFGFATRFYLAKLARKGGVGVSNCREHERIHPLIYMAIIWPLPSGKQPHSY